MRYYLFILLIIINCNNKVNHRNFNFIYEIEIEPIAGEKIEMWLPIPQSNEVQSISNLNIDINELNYSILKESKHDNKYLYIHDKLAVEKKHKIKMSFDVLRKEHSNISYNNVIPEKYLSSYNTVPTGSPFNAIIANNQLNNDNIRDIYDYVLIGMHYGKPKSIDNEYYGDPWLTENGKYGRKKVTRDVVVQLYQKAKEDKGNFTFGNGNALYACDIGVGNCTDYHSYFMSLCKTLGIPVRFHMGFSIPDSEKGIIPGYHCWADYFVEDQGWFPVDISEADKDPERKDYFFGNVCNNRVEFMVGRDFELAGYDQGLINLFIYPLLEIDDVISNAFKKKIIYKNI